MNIEERIKERLDGYNEDSGDSWGEFTNDIISICKEAIRKAKIEENKRWINKIGKDGWCIIDGKFFDRIKELESEK